MVSTSASMALQHFKIGTLSPEVPFFIPIPRGGCMNWIMSTLRASFLPQSGVLKHYPFMSKGAYPIPV